jgi:hypothetical protein
MAGVAASVSPAAAFLHESHHGAHHRGSGCFVTTSATHNTKGIRHWRSPCPHHERKHLNPYHPGHHRPHHPHPSPH